MDHEITSQWDEILGVWRRSLRASGKPDTTIKAYSLSYRRLHQWAEAGRVIKGPEDINDKHLDGFFASRYSDPGTIAEIASHSTVAMDFRHLRVFFNWLVAKGIINNSPMAGRKQPKVVEQPVPVFDDAELVALMNDCRTKSFADRRDLAMIRVLFDTGVRHNEIDKLLVVSLDRDKQMITVMGKGGKIRDVPYGARTAVAIDDYMIARNKHSGRGSKWLWLSSRIPRTGNRAEGPDSAKFGYDGLRLMLKRRAQRAGVKGRVFPHRFRHQAAHSQAKAGMTEGEMMYVFGWDDPTMPKRYGASAARERAIEKARSLSHADRI